MDDSKNRIGSGNFNKRPGFKDTYKSFFFFFFCENNKNIPFDFSNKNDVDIINEITIDSVYKDNINYENNEDFSEKQNNIENTTENEITIF